MSKVKNNTDSGEVVEGQLTKRAHYPWEDWADGKQRRLTKGVHFFCDPHVFTTAVYNHCRRHNAKSKKPLLEARCKTENDRHVLIQITKVTKVASRRSKTSRKAANSAAAGV
jgi:hypothetical protein